MALSIPEPLGGQHQLADFNSGVASLDEWLRRRARLEPKDAPLLVAVLRHDISDIVKLLDDREQHRHD